MAGAKDDEAASCPVDHKTRDAWLAQARAVQESQQQLQDSRPASLPSNPHLSSSSQPASTPRSSDGGSWAATFRSYIPGFSSPSPAPAAAPTPSPHAAPGLDTKREISSIPRASDPGPSACPANHEQESGADAASGNWVYPSEKMFFDAMKRKGHAARAADMATVVPIHNAVNERAWREIREWERPYIEGTTCGGPKLHSFAGQTERMSPKARINTLLGYTPPFDRHDWVIDRCGTQVEYVIDFYAGRSAGQNGKPSFYLDVRPKLNSWEGLKMRVLRGVGAV